MNRMRWLAGLGLVAVLLAVAVWQRADLPPPAPIDNGRVPLQVGILNYTDDYIDEVYVNRSWAGNGFAHSGGGGFAGSAEVPREWDPNYTLNIRWRDEPLFHKDRDAFYRRDVATQPYQQYEPGGITMLWIAFFPQGVIKLYPTRVDPGHPDFPEGLLPPKLQCRKERPNSDWCEHSGWQKRDKERIARENAKEATQ